MIEVKKYKVTFAIKPEYNAIWELELTESGAFAYGNQTCVVVTANGHHHDTIDTRYVPGITKRFREWCEEYLGSAFNPDFGPHFELIEE